MMTELDPALAQEILEYGRSSAWSVIFWSSGGLVVFLIGVFRVLTASAEQQYRSFFRGPEWGIVCGCLAGFCFAILLCAIGAIDQINNHPNIYLLKQLSGRD